MGIPASARVVTFLATRDKARAKHFYGTILGFPQIHEDDFAVAFDLNGTPLRISAVPDYVPQRHTVLGWEVPDIVATIEDLKRKGVTFIVYDGFGQDELGVWSAPGSGAKVAWFNDPDGNVLSLTQS
ncbi:MAG: VOC family protein [Alphaproteobacteria bacterium]|nr:VOC family protein [Alphaproteobacteria bacterium]